MSIRRIGACAALVVALALPATASAAKLKLDGKVKGIPDSTVSVGAKKRDGAIKKVTSMKFRGVPVSCSDGSTGAINGNMPTMRVRRNNFAAKTSIEGVSGQFRRGGRVVKGEVRFTFEAKSGASCTTDKRRFKASA